MILSQPGAATPTPDRAFDQQAPLFSISAEEQAQINLYQQQWTYATPPSDGIDAFHAKVSALARKLFDIKGLRENTRAIYNFIPSIVAKNREGILNDMSYTGISALDQTTGKENKAHTDFLRKLFKPRWKQIAKEVVFNGVVTGKSPVMLAVDQKGRYSVVPLYPNYTFFKRDPAEPGKVLHVDIKFSYLDDAGLLRSYLKRITPTEIITERDGEPAESVANPFGFIPVVEIKNIPIPGKMDGLNCFSMHTSDVDEVCEMVGDLMAAISFYGTPKIVSKGVSIQKELKVDVRQKFNIPEGADMKFLEWERCAEQFSNAKALYESMREKAVEFDIQKVMGRADVSGYAIRLIMSGFISKILDQKLSYEDGYAELGKMALAHKFKVQPEDCDVAADFGDALPLNLDEAIKREQDLKLLGLTTPEISMRRLRFEKADTDAVIEHQKKTSDLVDRWEQEDAQSKRPMTLLEKMDGE